MTIDIYKVSKSHMSAAAPQATDPTSQITAVLKEPCDVLRPVFQFSGVSFDTYGYNYLKCTLGGKTRYYWMQIKYISYDIREAICEEDFLATWWNDIKTSSQYVLRTDYDLYQNGMITDAAALSTNAVTLKTKETGDIYSPNNGFFVVGLMMAGVTYPIDVRGSVSYVLMTRSEMAAFKNTLLTTPGDIVNGIFDPIQYISSVVYIPIPLTGTGGIFDENQEHHVTDTMTFSSYTAAFPHTYFSDAQFNLRGLFRRTWSITSIDSHPDYLATEHNNYINYSPYSFIKCYAGPFGDFDIDRRLISGAVNFEITIDLIDGSAVMVVHSSGSEIDKKRGQLGIPVQIAQISRDIIGGVASAFSTVASVGSAMAGNLLGGVGGAMSGALSVINSLAPRVSSTGLNGSKAEIYDTKIRLTEEFYGWLEPSGRIGKPCCAHHTLTDFGTGKLIICDHSRVSAAGMTSEEQRSIEEALNYGIITG